MDSQKNFFQLLGDWLAVQQARRREAAAEPCSPRRLTTWFPSRGNVIFTLAMIALLVLAQSVGALPLPATLRAPSGTSTGTIAYQGCLADSAGAPLTGTYNMIFRLYDATTGGTPLWSEQWTGTNGVKVSDGLFNVMLGSLTALPQSAIAGRSQLFLGITVGTDDEMQPRVQLGSVPFAVQALTVPDGSVTTAKIADGAVTQAKLGADVSLVPPDGSITTAKIADGAVTSEKLSRRLTKVTPTGYVAMPLANTWYDILTADISLSRETLVTIFASAGPQNNQADAIFFTAISVDGNHVVSGEKLNPQGLGNTIMLSTGLLLGPGQHQIKLRAASWGQNGVINDGTRTQLVIIEG